MWIDELGYIHFIEWYVASKIGSGFAYVDVVKCSRYVVRRTGNIQHSQTSTVPTRI